MHNPLKHCGKATHLDEVHHSNHLNQVNLLPFSHITGQNSQPFSNKKPPILQQSTAKLLKWYCPQESST